MTDPVTLPDLLAMKRRGEKIACLTAYDASSAALQDEAGIEVILVGDSLGNVIQGQPTTLSVTLDHMVYHTACVQRAARRALVLADLPFLSYCTPEQAVRSAARLIRDGGAQVVKLEGGRERLDVVRFLTEQNVPVCGHLGLQPQAIHRLGRYALQGRDAESACRMVEDARQLAEAGAMLLVLECIPWELAQEITAAVDIPTIGIGAGRHCDGQVLVWQDMLGMSARLPRFCKDFLAGNAGVREAVSAYVREVKAGIFPGDRHSFGRDGP
ncbi:3-methyl-2-oxobutanoate hydroxymethyltransferase [Methylococcus capsulatus]|jgi:3-methyl-2-oxobutanoate hydroxymethyltransferase|uniref:3-methyl-2-oxobutanoate hydroxymethyltransferase n=2 Tax=Methylococcus capsulatus TaxID=414 RepID=PANB_METCA|nr:3-methyl-2-oxobutanoate hydroxymethyltransferase [Methylococcus capsulatus]Q605H0.1 RecName: Full=3-methyl-2-oxobutanoate hydroxymethyltransferase; AltName: Full=Ketopantoate hydroxymethyltransferase; Short=KPHMT [Methylococcus capsulatus str. Bath]AAU91633.1 3-methyl-2-oxobutanoate hydroxymethyltransferase [Methylococcus capsulatus str. Bath]QXP87104.1 3-methyl-2-oxobutanoate hydroxymethyltransferase [Methylococcus capsulatus]QXP91548.1 3-methyl-2-oxobutanoate hydroxymethyltransferase [Meth